ncbi:hypothetical protein DSM104299_03795 [Baekduia alba]|uniref:Vps62-related protein n=1 Tax=Baekduia alba TaxID=2997333 RepID=UPI002340B61F|nr:Vps62-related protein [Baekduia alba]WCB95053.1 hypothetical protein DSM104299_03795 [Baekduia alba]
MSDAAQLLERHQPYLKYDSQEAFFADAAEIFVESPGMRLRRKGSSADVAVAGDALSLAFLATDPDPYPGTALKPAATDTVGVPDKDYRARAAALHVQPELRNVCYGHVIADRDGARWLQYWYFYFYNDYNLIGRVIKAGLHEGDWETVQVRLNAADEPDYAVYAQHSHAAGRPWDQVERVPATQRPVVYVARGSHAAYFEPGTKWTGVWFDYADGKRQSPERQRLVEIVKGDAAVRWVRWPGRWGDTPKGPLPQDADSPRSPGSHTQWLDPLALLDVAATAAPALVPADRPAPPAAPGVTLTRLAGGDARLDWTVVPGADGTLPTALTITINSKDEPAPPRTFNKAIDGTGGSVALEGLDPANRYDVFVSDVSTDGIASESVRRDLA